MRPQRLHGTAAWLLIALFMLAGCGSLPPLQGRTPSYGMQDTASTPLGQIIAPQAQRHPALTGVEAVTDGRVAFGLRMGLARAATRSIDIQTFIWHDDSAGTLLYEEMLRAAERGVRVRLLLDDVNMSGLDPIFALLDSHPNIELRLYNPFVGRWSRTLGFLGDFERLNRRMHNKSFTVDNQASIVGGRNIANEYFGAGEDLTFADIDVLTVGAAVKAISTQFDVYWNSASAYPARLIINRDPAVSRAEFAKRAETVRSSPDARVYAEAIERTPQARALLTGQMQFEWTTVHVVHDDPAKTLGSSDDRDLQLLPKLLTAFGSPREQFDLVSPYFVPGEVGTQTLGALAQRGTRVRVLTNSLAGTDEVSVHAGYSRRREDLLRSGVELYEIKPDASELQKRSLEIGKHSKSGLHAKTFAIDRRSIFVGSFNFDPRSSRLNTEMGLVIESPAMAQRLSTMFDTASPGLAYRVTMGADGSLEWHDDAGVTHRGEPQTTWGRRMKVLFFSWLPIEWLL